MKDSANKTAIEAPELRFYRLYDSAQKPVLADESAQGLLPVRAYRYCEAARLASSVGWYVFPPVDFSVRYDGAAVHWRLTDAEEWQVLDNVVLAEEADRFDAASPEALEGHCPAFLGAAEEGMLQISTGLALRTNPGWGVLVRKPPNVPQKNHLFFYEGFVETDSWFGPLFINLKPLATDVTVRFTTDWPVAFVQPLPTALVRAKLSGCDSYVAALEDFDDDDWAELSHTLTNRMGPDRVVGQYARQVRKRGK